MRSMRSTEVITSLVAADQQVSRPAAGLRQVVIINPTAKTASAPVAGRARDEASWENPVRAVITPTVSSPTPATSASQPSPRT